MFTVSRRFFSESLSKDTVSMWCDSLLRTLVHALFQASDRDRALALHRCSLGPPIGLMGGVSLLATLACNNNTQR